MFKFPYAYWYQPAPFDESNTERILVLLHSEDFYYLQSLYVEEGFNRPFNTIEDIETYLGKKLRLVESVAYPTTDLINGY